MLAGNLMDGLPHDRTDTEMFDHLLSLPGVRIERIVSTGQASPPDFWYDQPQGEWVALVAGEARLRIDGEADARHLRVGDWLNLPARCRHRVDWTHPDAATIWLAVHYDVGHTEGIG